MIFAVWDGQCVQDFPSPNRTLKHLAYADFQNNSVALCKETCKNKRYIFAGVEAEGWCFCGNTPPSLDLVEIP